MYLNAQHQPVLEGDGSFEAVGLDLVVDGPDLVVLKVRSTWFGGDNDPEDSGQTASGAVTKGNPGIMGCALPMSGCHCPATDGSPLPKLPWFVQVKVYSWRTKRSIQVPLIDLGPAKPPRAHAAIDLTQAAFRALGASTREGEMTVSYRVIDGAVFLPSATKAAIAAALSR